MVDSSKQITKRKRQSSENDAFPSQSKKQKKPVTRIDDKEDSGSARSSSSSGVARQNAKPGPGPSTTAAAAAAAAAKSASSNQRKRGRESGSDTEWAGDENESSDSDVPETLLSRPWKKPVQKVDSAGSKKAGNGGGARKKDPSASSSSKGKGAKNKTNKRPKTGRVFLWTCELNSDGEDVEQLEIRRNRALRSRNNPTLVKDSDDDSPIECSSPIRQSPIKTREEGGAIVILSSGEDEHPPRRRRLQSARSSPTSRRSKSPRRSSPAPGLMGDLHRVSDDPPPPHPGNNADDPLQLFTPPSSPGKAETKRPRPRPRPVQKGKSKAGADPKPIFTPFRRLELPKSTFLKDNSKIFKKSLTSIWFSRVLPEMASTKLPPPQPSTASSSTFLVVAEGEEPEVDSLPRGDPGATQGEIERTDEISISATTPKPGPSADAEDVCGSQTFASGLCGLDDSALSDRAPHGTAPSEPDSSSIDEDVTASMLLDVEGADESDRETYESPVTVVAPEPAGGDAPVASVARNASASPRAAAPEVSADAASSSTDVDGAHPDARESGRHPVERGADEKIVDEEIEAAKKKWAQSGNPVPGNAKLLSSIMLTILGLLRSADTKRSACEPESAISSSRTVSTRSSPSDGPDGGASSGCTTPEKEAEEKALDVDSSDNDLDLLYP